MFGCQFKMSVSKISKAAIFDVHIKLTGYVRNSDLDLKKIYQLKLMDGGESRPKKSKADGLVKISNAFKIYLDY